MKHSGRRRLVLQTRGAKAFMDLACQKNDSFICAETEETVLCLGIPSAVKKKPIAFQASATSSASRLSRSFIPNLPEHPGGRPCLPEITCLTSARRPHQVRPDETLPSAFIFNLASAQRRPLVPRKRSGKRTTQSSGKGPDRRTQTRVLTSKRSQPCCLQQQLKRQERSVCVTLIFMCEGGGKRERLSPHQIPKSCH